MGNFVVSDPAVLVTGQPTTTLNFTGRPLEFAEVSLGTAQGLETWTMSLVFDVEVHSWAGPGVSTGYFSIGEQIVNYELLDYMTLFRADNEGATQQIRSVVSEFNPATTYNFLYHSFPTTRQGQSPSTRSAPSS
jgi:hypothetical protein